MHSTLANSNMIIRENRSAHISLLERWHFLNLSTCKCHKGLCEHSGHWATEQHGRPVTISSYLIRFVPESARNHAETDDTVPLLLAAQARTHTEPPNVTGEVKAHGSTGTRSQDLLQTMRALWPLSYRAARSTRDNFPQLSRGKLSQVERVAR